MAQLQNQHERSLILLNQSGIQKSNPSLYQLIKLIIDTITSIDNQSLLFEVGKSNIKSTDTNGTRIDFTKKFSSVQIMAIPILGTSASINVKECNITYFSIMAFNDAGARVSCPIQWLAYGSG